MKKFNNLLEGTDCGDAGLPARWRDTANAKTILRLVPKTPDAGSVVIQLGITLSSAAKGRDFERSLGLESCCKNASNV